MKRTLQFSIILVISLLVSALPGLQAGMQAQQTVTEDVTILPLPVPTNIIGTYVRGTSNDGKRLVVESINDYNGRNIDSNSEIWIYDVDTRAMVMITDTANIVETKTNADGTTTTTTKLTVNNQLPSISGDGTRVVFMSNASLGGTTNDDGNYEIYTADLPRGSTTPTFKRITDTTSNYSDETVKEYASNYGPTISDDGKTVAFLSTRVLFRPIANGPATFTALKEGSGNSDPDGNAEIFIYSEATQQYTQVTATRDVDATASFTVKGFNASPFLSGDGQVLAFLSGFNFPGATANKNTDFNGEIFVYRAGSPVNTVIQVTQTSAKAAVPFNGVETVLASGTHPLNFDGTKLVVESSGDFAAKNSDKTREIYLVDLSGTTPAFTQITKQATADQAKSDYGFFPSINAAGTNIMISSVLNLAPATTSSVKTDNADGSREVFRYNIATAKFTQFTFTALSDLVFDQRDNRTAPFINDAGNLATFSFESRSLLPVGPIISDLFQAVVRPVTSVNTEVAKMANAASYDNTQIARGSLVALFGTQLARGAVNASSANLPFELGGVTVKVAGIAARLIYVSPTQINFVMPLNIAVADTVDFAVNNNGVQSAGTVKVVDIAPGVFTATGDGKGRAAAQCGQVSSDGLTFPLTAPPCDVGNQSQLNTLVLYVTGVSNTQAVTVKIGDVTLLPSYVGPQPDFPGLDQINVGLSSDLANKADLEITVSATTTGTVDSNKSNISFLPADPAVSTVNAASFEASLVARGSLAIAQGTELAAAKVTATGNDLPFTLGNVTVTIAGKPARLSEVSPTAVTFVVPDDVKEADLAEVVVNNNGKKARGRVKTVNSSGGLFTATNDGNGQVTAKCGKVNADSTITYTNPPCAVGTAASPNLLRLFGTGWRFAESVTVKIGDSDVTPTFSGGQTGIYGIDVIDLKLIPALAGKADVDVIITTKVGTVSRISKSGVKISFSN